MYKTNERKFDVFRLHYFHGATRVGKYELPQLKSTQIIPREVVKFSDRKKSMSLSTMRYISFLTIIVASAFGKMPKDISTV